MAWLSGWTKRIKITIDKDQVDTTVSGFPTPIYLSASSGQSNDDVTAIFDELVSVSGTKKIAITTSDEETQCYVEIEHWDFTNEKAWLHVNVPTIVSGTDTELYIYYDSTQDDNTTYVGDVGDTPAQNVWDSNFKAVYHLGEDPSGGTDCIKDSTSNLNHGTPAGTMLTEDLVDGQFGKALDFDGSNDEVLTSNISWGDDDWTVEALFNGNQYRTVNRTIGAWRVPGAYTDGGGIYIGPDGTLNVFIQPNSNTVSSVSTFDDGIYHHVGVTVDYDGDFNVYVDSDSIGSAVRGVNDWGTHSLHIGNGEDSSTSWKEFLGVIDEFRVSNVLRSSSWFKATYEGLWDNLLTFGTEEELLVFTCSGTVQVDNILTDDMDVRLYRRSTGEFVGETTTISGGLFEINSTFEEDHYIIALYTTSGTNALIYDYIHH